MVWGTKGVAEMAQITYPNQRMVKIHREPAKSDFLGIKNANWQAAARDLGPHGLRLYLYLASNANNFTLALSPAAARAAVGIPRSTYFDYFQIMLNKGYLVPATGNTFDFYEVPQSAGQSVSADGLNFSECPRQGKDGISDGQLISPEDIEINNTENQPNNGGINNENKLTVDGNVYIPKVIEITIPRPKVEDKKKEKFVF